MDPELIGPYVVSHVAAVLYALTAWRWPRAARYCGAIVFLLAITPLGVGAAAPSTLIFAAGFVLMVRGESRACAGASHSGL